MKIDNSYLEDEEFDFRWNLLVLLIMNVINLAITVINLRICVHIHYINYKKI